jgi:cytochrome c peroxidase
MKEMKENKKMRFPVVFSQRFTIPIGMASGVALLLASSVLSGQNVDPLTTIDPLSKTASLKTKEVPGPSLASLAVVINDPTPGSPSMRALLRLGKALFWEQKIGSDGQACASCHFHAGADSRSLNELDPGLRSKLFPGGNTRFSPGFGPNYQLKLSDFPFHKVIPGTGGAGTGVDAGTGTGKGGTDPLNPDTPDIVISDSNNIVSSQGVFNADFTSIVPKNPFDAGIPSFTGPGAVFNVTLPSGASALVRNVEPRNTPSVINAVFNDRNFWDGRGRNEFNGVDPIGNLDPNAQVIKIKPATAIFFSLQMENSSASSQADGPPGSNLEMSFANRVTDASQMALIGRKILAAAPLAMQQIASDDSVLGGLPANTTYASLIKTAFRPEFWDGSLTGNKWILDVTTGTRLLKKVPAATTLTDKQFDIIEANFSMFFGMAIQEYESTLISDDSRFDKHMEALQFQRDGSVPAGFNKHFAPGVKTLTDLEQLGLQVFLGKGKCINCHAGPEFTSASVSNIQESGLLERMVMGDGQVAVYDTGFYNTSVRPTLEDVGIGDTIGPLNLPLSFSALYQQKVQAQVQQLMAANPALSLTDAVQQANQLVKSPNILARPLEAQVMLAQAGTSTVYLLQGAMINLLSACASMPDTITDPATGATIPNPDKKKAFNLLSATQKLISDANRLFTLPVPDTNAAAGQLILAYQKISQVALLAPAPSSQQAQASLRQVPGNMLLPDILKPLGNYAPPLDPSERIAVMGNVKTPSIRNAELTAPFFHNGGVATLEQVVDFYNRGGDFPEANQHDLDIDITRLGLTQVEKDALVAFMKACTDERVRYERAPFDHPSLNIPNGGGLTAAVPFSASFPIPILDDRVIVPAVGAGGLQTPSKNFLQP